MTVNYLKCNKMAGGPGNKKWRKGVIQPYAKPWDMSPEAIKARHEKSLATRQKNRERGEKWSEGLKKLQKECGSEPLTEKMTKDIFMSLLGIPAKDVERIARDDKEKMLYAVVAAGLLGDRKRGELRSLLAIIERLFGKVPDHIEVTSKSAAEQLAESATENELLAVIGEAMKPKDENPFE
jgi:hypothetical protein